MRMDRIGALRAAHGHVLARRFGPALAAIAPWRGDPAGALLHALALAGSGAVAAAAPLLAAIAAQNPASRHPVLDLLPLVEPGDGVAHLRAARALRPDDRGVLAALGERLAERGPVDEALACFERAAGLPGAAAADWSNWGKALAAEARFDEADAAFETARHLAPGVAQIAYNHALARLKAGRMAEGWAALRVRHRLPGRPPPLPGPLLECLDVAGRTVLLRHEEGFGDTLQLIRYAGPLAERGALVVASMPEPLRRVVATAPGVAAVVKLDAAVPYDRWIPLLDVPALFGGAIAGGVPYLWPTDPPPALPPGRRIGLAWAGDPQSVVDHLRSAPVEALEPLRALPGVQWISLQKGRTPPPWMHAPMPQVRDFADTAAIVAALDAVISVDTAVAHLAAALGKPVLLLDRYDSCWRWLTGRADSPWYPTLRIVRQATPGDWSGVVARAAGLIRSGFGADG